MKGPFGMLLVGGGIILLVGLFTGKITFPGVDGSTTGGLQPGAKPAPVGSGNKLSNPNPDLSCPKGKKQVIVSGGKVMCL